jgi:hypothetical protein
MSAHPEAGALLRASFTTQFTTGWHASPKGRCSCGRSKGLSLSQFFHRRWRLTDMENVSVLVTTGQVLSCFTWIHTSGKWGSSFVSSSPELLQRLLFNRTLGEEVVQKAEQPDVWFLILVGFVTFSHINSGYASLNQDGKLLMVSNLKDGVDEYQFPSLEKVQSFKHPIATNCILQTRSLPSWNLIVTGGDNGFARVFNRISGQLVAEIRHGGSVPPPTFP